MKTDGGHEVDEKDLEEMGMAAGEEPKTSNTSLEEYTGTSRALVNFADRWEPQTGKPGFQKQR